MHKKLGGDTDGTADHSYDVMLSNIKLGEGKSGEGWSDGILSSPVTIMSDRVLLF